MVSIHAPAGGATGDDLDCYQLSRCFNPRTRGGCDNSRKCNSNRQTQFQSTHPRGVRPGRGAGQAHACTVSIHAPAGGATQYWSAQEWQGMFQSTHPRGVRPSPPFLSLQVLCFNPRTRGGCDAQGIQETLATQRFQSTHPRGVRLTDADKILQINQFQSTHPRGVRRFYQHHRWST